MQAGVRGPAQPQLYTGFDTKPCLKIKNKVALFFKWSIHLISAFRREKQEDVCELEPSLM